MDNLSILKYSIFSTKTILNTVLHAEPHKQILDPLSCIIRLGLLTFKDKYTKISIANNKIYFQAPDILQGPVRWTFGDGRADLHNLCNPIEKAILWYNPIENKCIDNIFKLSVEGLTRLKQSYIVPNNTIGDSNLVCHSISHYITLIQNKINNVDTLSHLPDEHNVSFKILWCAEEIEIIDNLFILANDKRKK